MKRKVTSRRRVIVNFCDLSFCDVFKPDNLSLSILFSHFLPIVSVNSDANFIISLIQVLAVFLARRYRNLHAMDLPARAIFPTNYIY